MILIFELASDGSRIAIVTWYGLETPMDVRQSDRSKPFCIQEAERSKYLLSPLLPTTIAISSGPRELAGSKGLLAYLDVGCHNSKV